MNLNKILQIANIDKDLLRESFFSDLPRRYINLYTKLLISGQKSDNEQGFKNPGILKALDNRLFPVIYDFYNDLISQNRLNIHLKRSDASDFNYQFSRLMTSDKFKRFWFNDGNRYRFMVPLENPLTKSDISPEHLKLTSVQKLLNMPDGTSLIIYLLKANTEILDVSVGAKYNTGSKMLENITVYINFAHFEEELKQIQNITSEMLRPIIVKLVNEIKGKVVNELKNVIYHELIHLIQDTSEKPANVLNIDTYKNKHQLLKRGEPLPRDADYKDIKSKYDEYYKNLSAKNLLSVSSNIEVQAYIKESLQFFKKLTSTLNIGKITQEAFNKSFVSYFSALFKMLKNKSYEFSEKHFSKKVEMLGHSYDYKTMPDKAFHAVLSRFFSIIMNDYKQSQFINVLKDNIKLFSPYLKYLIEISLTRASGEKHTLNRV